MTISGCSQCRSSPDACVASLLGFPIDKQVRHPGHGILATPIINFPDIAIMGVHRIMKRPGVVETPQGDKVEVRQYMNFSASVDHRLADGADGARFLVYIKRLLENPGLLAL
jgi:pyruvate dehydrogenase E2 component (dihydrolipoamide acetyltransferase)